MTFEQEVKVYNLNKFLYPFIRPIDGVWVISVPKKNERYRKTLNDAQLLSYQLQIAEVSNRRSTGNKIELGDGVGQFK